MKRVIIESPYAGETDEETQANIDYAKKCVHHSLKRGEAPFPSHLLYTQPGILDDKIPGERMLGINAGFAWGELADLVAVYVDRGISPGMKKGIERAIEKKQKIEYRKLDHYI